MPRKKRSSSSTVSTASSSTSSTSKLAVGSSSLACVFACAAALFRNDATSSKSVRRYSGHIGGARSEDSSQFGAAKSEETVNGDCPVLTSTQPGSWQAALHKGSPVIAPLAELAVLKDRWWELAPDDSLVGLTISPDGSFYGQRNDVASHVGLRRVKPARLEDAPWGLVHDLMAYLVARAGNHAHDAPVPLPPSLENATLRNAHDPLHEGAVPLRAALARSYRFYVSGESNRQMFEPQLTAPLRAIARRVLDAMGRDFEVVNAWVSAGGTTSNLHFDGGDNWLCQLAGSKTATMFHPAESDKLYPIKFDHELDHDFEYVLRPSGEVEPVAVPLERRDDKHYAAVDLRSPNLARFPEFARTRPRVCTIRPGQCLGLPHHVWHNIVADEEGEINVRPTSLMQLNRAIHPDAVATTERHLFHIRWQVSLNFGFGPSQPTEEGGMPPEFRAEMKMRTTEMKARGHLQSTRHLA